MLLLVIGLSDYFSLPQYLLNDPEVPVLYIKQLEATFMTRVFLLQSIFSWHINNMCNSMFDRNSTILLFTQKKNIHRWAKLVVSLELF